MKGGGRRPVPPYTRRDAGPSTQLDVRTEVRTPVLSFRSKLLRTRRQVRVGTREGREARNGGAQRRFTPRVSPKVIHAARSLELAKTPGDKPSTPYADSPPASPSTGGRPSGPSSILQDALDTSHAVSGHRICLPRACCAAKQSIASLPGKPRSHPNTSKGQQPVRLLRARPADWGRLSGESDLERASGRGAGSKESSVEGLRTFAAATARSAYCLVLV